MNLGERIKYYRKKSGLTQQQLADSIGVQRAAISKYEKNIVSISMKQLSKIAEVLKIDIYELTAKSEEERKEYEECRISNSSVKQLAEIFESPWYYGGDEFLQLLIDTTITLYNMNYLGLQEAYNYIQYLTTQEKYTKPDNED